MNSFLFWLKFWNQNYSLKLLKFYTDFYDFYEIKSLWNHMLHSLTPNRF